MKYHNIANSTVPPNVTELKFMDSALTLTDAGQNEKNHMTIRYTQANRLFAVPNAPGTFQGPHRNVSGPTTVARSLYGSMPWNHRQRSREQIMKYEA